MRRYAAKVQLLGTSGDHVRWVPAAVAEALVNAEHAAIQNQNGKVKSVKLVACAENSAQRIGEPQPLSIASYGTRFVRPVKLDSGHVIWEHHRRALEQ